MELSARNALKGTVKEVVHGAVETEVTIEIAPGIELVAMITKSSALSLKLAQGEEVKAVVKATDVMIAV